MRIHKLTVVAQALNAALGSGAFHDITNDDVWQRIEDGSIFDFLSERLGIGVPISVLSPVDRLELLMEWTHGFCGIIVPFRFDAHRNGLCLLVGFLLEGIAHRARDRNYRLTPETCGAAVPPDEAG
jgi:hypothetical protein